MKRLALLFMTAASVLVPINALAQSPTSIEDVRQLAGEWEGWIGSVLTGIVIKEDGSYEGFGAEGRPVAGRIVVKDGKASYKSNLAEGSVFLYQQGGKSSLRFVTSSGGIAEAQRVK
jgi:hypothetical protein